MTDATPRSSRKLVTITLDMARRVDDYRWGQRIPSESEALRRLIVLGLDEVERTAVTENPKK